MNSQLQEQCRERRAARISRRHKGRKPTEEEIISALEGRTVIEAARFLGYYSSNGLRYVMHGYGMEIERRICEEDADLICKLINAGVSRADVAEKFDVTEKTVSATYHKYTGRYLPTARNKKKDGL